MDRSNNMNNTNHMNDTHNMNDTNWSNMGDMDDMDDMDNDTMSGECDSGMSMHFGGGIFNSKKFFKEITNMCIDVRFPRELYKRSKQCLKQEAKKSSLFDNMMKGKFPEKQELAKFMEASCSCQLKAGGINDMNRDLTVEKLLQYMMVDQWGGDEKDKNDLRQQITTCFNQAQGNGYKKLIEYHKCLVKYYLEECEKNDDEPGVILVESSKLLTIGEESKCAPVRLPKDMQQVSDRCLQQAKTNMKKMPESSTTSTSGSGSGSGQDMRSMKLLKHFGMEYMMKAAECFLTELKMFDTQKKIVDINGLTEYVKKFEGWNGIERERDQVIAAITNVQKLTKKIPIWIQMMIMIIIIII
ncbi:hypothetical protein Avbf_02961 [Armadillidium vulgare]|nr:hypothetical protein Avbf_02961 [Armadillidium vulgare]